MNALGAIARRLDVTLLLASVALFTLLPGIDLTVAALTWADGHFTQADHPVVRFVYQVLAYSQYALGIGLLAGLLVARLTPSLRRWRRPFGYLVLVLVCGPGLLVNVVLKDHSLDRPRPNQIEPFGGTAAFAPFGHYSGECERNCSFVSGHAAIAFFPIAFAWTSGRRRWLLIGVAAGALAGSFRILQGGHFVSDVVFAFWAVYWTCVGLAALPGLSPPRPAMRAAPPAAPASDA